MNKGSLRAVLALLTFALLLAACGAPATGGTAASPSGSSAASSAASGADSSAPASAAPSESETSTTAETSTAAGGATTTLRVGATPVPAGEILQFVDENLAAGAGLDLELVEFTDYVQPNIALNDGQIDANLFQHVPYMEDFGEQRGIDMAAVTGIYIVPLGIYSRQVQSLEQVPDGATIAIPNDVTNAGRALLLMQANGLITLREGVGQGATVRDIVENSKNLQIRELEAAQLPRALDDAALSIINGNYALEADLKPNEDALALETPENNPYVNVLTVLGGQENEAAVQTLSRLLTSPEVKQFIDDTYQGAVIPIF